MTVMASWQARAESPAGAIYTCGLTAANREAAERAVLAQAPFPVVASLVVVPVQPGQAAVRKATGG
jgi:hypothetical protein